MSVTIPTQTDKCRGAMIATAMAMHWDGPMKYVQKTSLKMPEMATILCLDSAQQQTMLSR